jgi:hypothetical protein
MRTLHATIFNTQVQNLPNNRAQKKLQRRRAVTPPATPFSEFHSEMTPTYE